MQNGVDIKFKSYISENLPQLEIENYDLDAANYTLINETVREYTPAIRYDSIPYKMLRTMSSNTQLKVEVDGLLSVCGTNKLDCTVKYVESENEDNNG